MTGFGANLNAGWFHRAAGRDKVCFNLEFGLVAMGAFFSEDQRVFSSSGLFRFDRSTADLLIPPEVQDPTYRTALIDELVTISGPTAVGSETDSIRVSFSGGSKTLRSPFTGADTTIGL